ncbi:MAG TPA: hypothetical protein DEQ32_14195 [Gammaproteobacteria bacterium]|nr:hypothetical protein [Gammaproteobacteria bacterium]
MTPDATLFDLGMTIESVYANANNFALSFQGFYSGVRADFKAFITSYTDDYGSQWSAEQPYGKADPRRQFGHTHRSIQIAWDIPAANINEAEENLRRVSALTQMLYPVYENRGYSEAPDKQRWCIAAPPLIVVKFSNLIKEMKPSSVNLADSSLLSKRFMGATDLPGLICTIEDLSINHNVSPGFFEVGPETLYPKLMQVNCTLTVLHEVSPGILADQYGRPQWDKTFGHNYGVRYGEIDGRDGVSGASDNSLKSAGGVDDILGGGGSE